MKALRLPAGASTVAYFVRFRRPHDPPVFVSAKALLEGLEAPSWPGHLRAGRPQFRLTSRGRQWDLSGLQVIHSVPLLRSQTPVELVCPCLSGHTGAAPRFFKSGGFGRQEKFRGSLTQLPGRRGGYPPRPPQIRTCPIRAYGSSCERFVPSGVAVSDPRKRQWLAV
jgi:hypothetical protein